MYSFLTPFKLEVKEKKKSVMSGGPSLVPTVEETLEVRQCYLTLTKGADWFQIGKGIRQGCILSPCLFNFYAGYIMRHAGLEETQAGIKISRRNINNLRYADDNTLMAEIEEEIKSLLMKAQHSENEDHGIWSPSLHGK